MNDFEIFVAFANKAMAAGDPQVTTPFGIHGITYGTDEDGDVYATVGLTLRRGAFAEIEDGTYGELVGIRFYLDSK